MHRYILSVCQLNVTISLPNYNAANLQYRETYSPCSSERRKIQRRNRTKRCIDQAKEITYLPIGCVVRGQMTEIDSVLWSWMSAFHGAEWSHDDQSWALWTKRDIYNSVRYELTEYNSDYVVINNPAVFSDLHTMSMSNVNHSFTFSNKHVVKYFWLSSIGLDFPKINCYLFTKIKRTRWSWCQHNIKKNKWNRYIIPYMCRINNCTQNYYNYMFW